MKTKLRMALAACILLCAGVHAQITVTGVNFATPGTTILNAYDSITTPTPTVVPGPAGTNQTWNFSSLHAHVRDSTHVKTAASCPYASSYPAATIVLSHASLDAYCSSPSTGLYVYGEPDPVGDGINTLVAISTPPSLFIKWPSTYATTYTDNYKTFGVSGLSSASLPGYDSIKIKYYDTCKVTIDAWGTIITPLGTFPCIRQKRQDAILDSEFVHHSGPPFWVVAQVTKDTMDTYTWWSNDPIAKYALAKQQYLHSAKKFGIVTWLYGTTVGIEEHSEESVFEAFPNPASDYIDIRVKDGIRISSLSILDISGRTVLHQQIQGLDLIRVETGTIPNGMYFLILNGSDGKQHTHKICMAH
ncbi:MAG TPA: T9SS type A sorting domain-containing protein [Bacteroidia bacterium]|nr:T9SS type A sorting domain-containing protein [Bacteroidia bacterium]